ncbi:unnamed protein product [Brassica rapa subsp. narinosa]
MRLPPDCRPSLGASAPPDLVVGPLRMMGTSVVGTTTSPKGTCRWLSPFGGSTVRTALNYNYHRAAVRILCRRLKYATGYCKWQSGLAATIY